MIGWWLWMSSWEGMVALNVQTKKRWWFWMSNYGEMMTLNAWMWERRLPERLKLRRDSGSECQTEERWWLWTPNWKYDNDGLERQNWKCDSQRQAENAMMALNAETEMWFRTPNEAKHGSKRRNERCNGFERRMKMWLWTPNWDVILKRRTKQNMALNARMSNVMALNVEWRCGSESRTKRRWWWLWTSNWKHDDGSERWNWKVMVALNVENW